MADNSKKNNRLIKLMIGSVAAVLVAALAFGVVFAYLSGKTGSVNNKMTSDGDPIPTIVETFEPSAGIKQNVAVSVGVDYECYVRAAILVNWVSEDGKTVYPQKPVLGTDYTLDLNTAASDTSDKSYWLVDADSGYYYYTAPVKNGSTENLINECKQLANAPSGYFLNVQIVAQTIQASGKTDAGVPAVKAEWGVTLNDERYIVSVP